MVCTYGVTVNPPNFRPAFRSAVAAVVFDMPSTFGTITYPASAEVGGVPCELEPVGCVLEEVEGVGCVLEEVVCELDPLPFVQAATPTPTRTVSANACMVSLKDRRAVFSGISEFSHGVEPSDICASSVHVARSA